jgi:hypothetical protein
MLSHEADKVNPRLDMTLDEGTLEVKVKGQIADLQQQCRTLVCRVPLPHSHILTQLPA